MDDKHGYSKGLSHWWDINIDVLSLQITHVLRNKFYLYAKVYIEYKSSLTLSNIYFFLQYTFFKKDIHAIVFIWQDFNKTCKTKR